MLKVAVSAAPPCRDVGQLRGKHAMLQQPVAHVVIFPAPPPEIRSIPIHPPVLLPGEDGDSSKKVLQQWKHWMVAMLLFCNMAAVVLHSHDDTQLTHLCSF